MIGLGIAVVVIIVLFISSYNAIVSKHETITAKWAQVDNQLQRRNDLIPNLVNSVKGYAAHEKEVFETVTNARSQWAKAGSVDEKVKAASAVDAALSRLLFVAENYPNLKADNTFLKLMDELAGTENRISVERRRFNETVQSYNTMIRRFPASFIASMGGFKDKAYFSAATGADQAPKVQF